MLGRDTPGMVVLFAILPPGDAVSELLELQGFGLGIALAAFGQRLLVVPDIACVTRAIKEEDVGGNTGIGGEDTIWQSQDGMEVEVAEEFFFDTHGDTIAEEGTI